MKRRNLIIASALAASAGLGAAFFGAGNGEPESAYPRMTLNSSTLAPFPDSSKTITEAIKSDRFKNMPVVVEYVAGWCPHCAKLEPEMDKALEDRAAAGNPVGRLTVVVQEGDHRTGERGAFGYIRAFRQMTAEPYFPQVQVWQNGQNKGYFVGERSAVQINVFIDTKLGTSPQPAPAAQPN